MTDPTVVLTEAEWERLRDAISEVRDDAPRIPNDADSGDIADAVELVVRDLIATRLAAVEALTVWAVPEGYLGGPPTNGHAPVPVSAVRLDELLAALSAPAPDAGQREARERAEVGPWVRCADVKTETAHDPHWHVIRAGNITVAQGQCRGYAYDRNPSQP